MVDYRVGIFPFNVNKCDVNDKNYVVQCNTVPNNKTIANVYMYIRI